MKIITQIQYQVTTALHKLWHRQSVCIACMTQLCTEHNSHVHIHMNSAPITLSVHEDTEV